MTSELRPAVEVWRDAMGVHHMVTKRWALTRECPNQAAADVIEADREAVRAEQAAEIERLRERWAMIDQLRGAEGCSVEIIHDNPDPGASNCAIYVTDNFGEDYSTYYGDTVDDCLRQAVEARTALGESHD